MKTFLKIATPSSHRLPALVLLPGFFILLSTFCLCPSAQSHSMDWQ